MRILADSGGKKRVDAVTAIQDDIAAYAGPLQRHVMSKADDMEYRLEDCEAQSKTAINEPELQNYCAKLL